MKRSLLLEEPAGRITLTEQTHPLRVAIDGPDAAGKTSLAQELGEHHKAHGRPVIRSSIDGFHKPASIRYKRGIDTSEGKPRLTATITTHLITMRSLSFCWFLWVLVARANIAGPFLTTAQIHHCKLQLKAQKRMQFSCSMACSCFVQNSCITGISVSC